MDISKMSEKEKIEQLSRLTGEDKSDLDSEVVEAYKRRAVDYDKKEYPGIPFEKIFQKALMENDSVHRIFSACRLGVSVVADFPGIHLSIPEKQAKLTTPLALMKAATEGIDYTVKAHYLNVRMGDALVTFACGCAPFEPKAFIMLIYCEDQEVTILVNRTNYDIAKLRRNLESLWERPNFAVR